MVDYEKAAELLIDKVDKLREQVVELKAENEKLTSTRKCSCGEDIYFYTYCPRCRKNWES